MTETAILDRTIDLDTVARAYTQWLTTARGIVGTADPPDDRSAFATRSELVH